MKKLLLIIGFFMPLMMSAQDESVAHFSKKNALKISPIEFGNAEFQLSYERYFGDRSSSIQFTPSFILEENGDESREGWQAMLQYRFYLTHLKSSEGKSFWGLYNIGFYTGVYGLYFNQNEELLRYYYDNTTGMSFNEIYARKITAGEGGALIGMQVDITPRIVIDFYVGGGIRYTEIDDEFVPPNNENYYNYFDVFDPGYKGVKPKLGLQLGITF
jgi:hypothetical protein